MIYSFSSKHEFKLINRACLHLLVFTDRNTQGFPIVLLSMNFSIRSIVRYFPIAVNPGKRMFPGILLLSMA